jgi:hypothetical protein
MPGQITRVKNIDARLDIPYPETKHLTEEERIIC